MSRPSFDYTEQRHGHWTAIRFDKRHKGNNYWICRCDCGVTRSIGIAQIRSGHSKSCGCGINEDNGPFKHGLALTPIYESWRGMKKRCLCPTHEAYHNYGGRGIKICAAILDSPAAIVDCIGDRPRGLTLDRKDNDGHYSCGKCPECEVTGWPMNLRWATVSEQGRNTRYNLIVEIEGERLPACEWADKLGIERSVFYQRVHRGETGALLTGPLRRNRRKAA